MDEYDVELDEEPEVEEFAMDCGECGSPIYKEEYNRTGTYDFCENCDLDCGDPRGHTFENCGCFD